MEVELKISQFIYRFISPVTENISKSITSSFFATFEKQQQENTSACDYDVKNDLQNKCKIPKTNLLVPFRKNGIKT